MTEEAFLDFVELTPGVASVSSAFPRASGPLREFRLLLPDQSEGLATGTVAGTISAGLLSWETAGRNVLPYTLQAPAPWGNWPWVDLGCTGVNAWAMGLFDVEVVKDMVMTWKTPSHPCKESENISAAITRSFSSLRDVCAIYIDESGPAPKASVLVGKRTYDDALMDRLLAKEKEILMRFRPMYVSFSYPPDPGRDKRRQTVGAEAALVFER